MSKEQNREQESSFLFFLRLVITNWKFLLITYFTVGIITVIILLLVPKWYKSEATVVILEENKSPLTSLLSEFSSLGLGIGAGKGGVDTYFGYLNTKKVYNRLIEEFNLDEVYESNYKEDVYDAIRDNLSTIDNEDNTFTISYTYKEDPEKAFKIVHYLFEELNKITLEVDQAQASHFRTYIENYYNEVKTQLKASEDSLSRFQSKTGLLDLESQIEYSVQSLINLEQQRINFEIQKEYLSGISENNSQVPAIENQISVISSKIEELKNQPNNTILALDILPEIGMEFLRLQRDILVGEKVAEFLRLQYEQALLDEQKINSNLYLIDPPQIPQKKYKPQRVKILIVVMFLTVTLSLGYIRLKEYYLTHQERLKSMLTSG